MPGGLTRLPDECYEGMDQPGYDYNAQEMDWEATHNDPPSPDETSDDNDR